MKHFFFEEITRQVVNFKKTPEYLGGLIYIGSYGDYQRPPAYDLETGEFYRVIRGKRQVIKNVGHQIFMFSNKRNFVRRLHEGKIDTSIIHHENNRYYFYIFEDDEHIITVYGNNERNLKRERDDFDKWITGLMELGF